MGRQVFQVQDALLSVALSALFWVENDMATIWYIDTLSLRATIEAGQYFKMRCDAAAHGIESSRHNFMNNRLQALNDVNIIGELGKGFTK
jgi:hypothetical protein